MRINKPVNPIVRDIIFYGLWSFGTLFPCLARLTNQVESNLIWIPVITAVVLVAVIMRIFIKRIVENTLISVFLFVFFFVASWGFTLYQSESDRFDFISGLVMGAINGLIFGLIAVSFAFGILWLKNRSKSKQ